jgi:FkbM family methyltransferase
LHLTSLNLSLRDLIRKAIRLSGFEIRRIDPFPPAAMGRPVGSLRHFFEDLRGRGFEAHNIIDIGANKTNWSKEAANIFPDARFFLFDPLVNFEQGMRDFVTARPGSRFWLAGVGPEEGQMQFNAVFRPDGSPDTGSSFNKPWQDNNRYIIEGFSVPMVTLDGLVKSGELPASADIVKIDTEGFELRVLAGAQSLFGKVHLFILETSLYPFWFQPIFHEVVAYMAERDYLLYDCVGFNRRPKDGGLGQIDAVFVRRDSALRRETAWTE